MMQKVFFDTDIILDVATARQPFCVSSSKVLAMAERKEIIGITSPIVFLNVSYIARKFLGKEQATEFLKNLETIISVESSDKNIIHKALYSDFTDFEDAVQNYTAETANADCIVTRNKKDYSTSSLQVFLPDEFLQDIKYK